MSFRIKVYLVFDLTLRENDTGGGEGKLHLIFDEPDVFIL